MISTIEGILQKIDRRPILSASLCYVLDIHISSPTVLYKGYYCIHLGYHSYVCFQYAYIHVCVNGQHISR